MARRNDLKFQNRLILHKIKHFSIETSENTFPYLHKKNIDMLLILGNNTFRFYKFLTKLII